MINLQTLSPAAAPYLSFAMNAQRERFDPELHEQVGQMAVGQHFTPELGALISTLMLTLADPAADKLDAQQVLDKIAAAGAYQTAAMVAGVFDALADGAQDNRAAVHRMAEALRTSIAWLPSESISMVAVFAKHDRIFVPKLAWELLGAALIARAQVTRCPTYTPEVNALLRGYLDCMRDPAREFECDARLAEFGRRGLAPAVGEALEWWDSFAHLLGGEVGLESAPSKLARERRIPM